MRHDRTSGPDVDVEPCDPTHREAVLALWDGRLGSEYANPGVLDRASDPATGVHWHVALAGERVVGFAVARLLTGAAVVRRFRRDAVPGWVKEPVGLLDTGAVAEPVEGQGTGRRLLERQAALLGDRAVAARRLVAAGPESRQHHALGGAWFERAETVPDYWHDGSLEEGYRCPKCGQPYTCTAVVCHRPPGLTTSVRSGHLA